MMRDELGMSTPEEKSNEFLDQLLEQADEIEHLIELKRGDMGKIPPDDPSLFPELVIEAKERGWSWGGPGWILNYRKSVRELEVALEVVEANLEFFTRAKGLQGWGYLDDVCYLSSKQQGDFEVLRRASFFQKYKPREKEIFKAFNRLAYLSRQIHELGKTAKRIKVSRLSAPPAKEILKVLEWMQPEDPTLAALVEMLAGFEADYAKEIANYKTRALYLAARRRTDLKHRVPPKSQLQALRGAKADYSETIKELAGLLKSSSPRRYLPDFESLLLHLNFPVKPSEIS